MQKFQNAKSIDGLLRMCLTIADIDRNRKATTSHPMKLRWIAIKSRLLDGETIVIVFNKDALTEVKRKYPNTVIYSLLEIQELLPFRHNKDFIRKVHLVKKEFDGWIIPTKETMKR